jgi:hypothetical protein
MRFDGHSSSHWGDAGSYVGRTINGNQAIVADTHPTKQSPWVAVLKCVAKDSLPLGQQYGGYRFAGKGRGRLAIDGDGDLFTPLNGGQQLACVRDSHK